MGRGDKPLPYRKGNTMNDLKKALFYHLCSKGIFFDNKIGEKTQVFIDERNNKKFVWLHQLDNPSPFEPIAYYEKGGGVARGIYHIEYDNYYSFWIDEEGKVTEKRESPLPDDPYFNFGISEVTVDKDGKVCHGEAEFFTENDCPDDLKEKFARQVKYWLDKALAVKVDPNNVFEKEEE